MSLDDRHQIVILTSAFHGYDVEVELGIFQAPFAPGVNPALAVQSKQLPRLKVRVPYVPQPFEAEQLMLTRSELAAIARALEPARTARPGDPSAPDFTKVFANLQRVQDAPEAALVGTALAEEFVFFPGIFKRPEPQQLDLSEWCTCDPGARSLRPHRLRGELWPFRHRAALIKVTERKFKETTASSSPTRCSACSSSCASPKSSSPTRQPVPARAAHHDGHAGHRRSQVNSAGHPTLIARSGSR